MNGTRHRSRFEGRWVNTIVFTRPNRAASGAAASAETAARTLAAARMAPMTAGSAANRSASQKAMKPCMTKPPAKASRAKRAARPATTCWLRWRPRRERTVWSVASGRATSTAGVSCQKRTARRTPTSAYPTITPRYTSAGAARSGRPAAAWTMRPAVSVPAAVASVPASWYRVKRWVRRLSGTSWVSEACSTARNGPTSLPLGLMTPMVAATRSTAKTGVAAKARPAARTRSAPSARTRRRPIRSAWVVSQSEIAASPRRVRASSRPISAPP